MYQLLVADENSIVRPYTTHVEYREIHAEYRETTLKLIWNVFLLAILNHDGKYNEHFGVSFLQYLGFLMGTVEAQLL